MIADRKPPIRETGAIGWMRRNLFGGWTSSVATVVLGAVLVWGIVGLAGWIFGGANWERLWVNLKLLMTYQYPADLLWRPLLALGLIMFAFGLSCNSGEEEMRPIVRGAFYQFTGVLVFLAVLSTVVGWAVTPAYWVVVGLCAAGWALGRAGDRGVAILQPVVTRAGWIWLASLILVAPLLYGIPGIHDGFARVVEIRRWGGFMLTLVLTTGIIPSFPLGVALALGRRSDLPGISWTCIGFIELIRGAPLIVWLYIANLMVPLLFAVGPETVSGLAKAYIAVTLFSSAYMAENVRGGLQAVPMGQGEAARALGLSGWQTTRLIVLPQAIRAVIPAIVGQSIGLFKDTALVFVVNLFDFFNVHNVVVQQPGSIAIPGGIRMELSLFLAVVYFFVAYRMSMASRQLEKVLGVGER